MVADDVSVYGKPCKITLDNDEEDLLRSLGIILSGSLLSYQHILLSTSKRTVTTDSKKTLRDNSGVIYKKEGTYRVGTLHKVIKCNEGTFAFIKTLIPCGEALCTDDTTQASINDHLMKMSSPRYA